MMLPTFISVSVAPGSYFFWALAALATASASSPASATDLAWLKTWWCIIVLPDVLAEGSGSLWNEQRCEPSDRMRRSVCTIEVALPAGAWLVFSAERKRPGPHSFEFGQASSKARTVKCGGHEGTIVSAL